MDIDEQSSSYGAVDTEVSNGEDVEDEEAFVTIGVDVSDDERPTLAPIGSRLKRNAQIAYNPFNWNQTLWVVKGRPYVGAAYYVVAAIGTVLVCLSSLKSLRDDSRTCRAWCTNMSLNAQPHQYIGFILFLLMSFRTSNSYRNYVTGQKAFYDVKASVRVFTSALLSITSRDALSRNQRARMVAYIIAFPFALTSEIRKERRFEKKELKDVVSDADLNKIMDAPSMAQFILESLNNMVKVYIPKGETIARKTLHSAINSLYKPYTEAERIQFNPMGFAYVVHLRLLLLTYLITLPLAFVEKLGFATIFVHWVITYALMSVEMLAVEVENPFGHQGSDLRLYQYNILMRDSVLESWDEWDRNMEQTHQDESLISSYSSFGSIQNTSQNSQWFTFY